MGKIKINRNEERFIKFINDYELDIFTFDELQSHKHLNIQYLQDTLESLVNRAFLNRIEKGKYCRHNFRNEYVIGNYLANGGSIAYWSALNIHGLTEQISNTVFVQTTKLKKDKSVFGVRYKFVKVKPEKICGITTLGYGNGEFRITDTEKTLLDCFDLPQYSGGYEELIRAFYHAKISSTRLFEYGMKMGNLSVLKRLAFLSELFEMKGFTRFREQVLKILNQRYTLIDPMGLDRGEFVSKWRIRLNISRNDLLGMIKNMY
jgi:predicted transcriptional regulator of viral defense system